MKKAKNILTLATLVATGMPFYQTTAQEGVLEEVLVTSTKRGEEVLQSVSASIFALGGQAMEEKGQLDFEDFAGSVPGLQFQDLGPGDKEYIIRGINGNGPAVVGAYFDEFVITATDAQDGGGKNAPIKMIDIDRIEVLNGPQGTLYGANSMAGTIRFIPRKPSTEEFEAFVDLDSSDTNEGDNNYTVSGGVNIPLIESKLAARLVAWTVDNSGWIDQPRREITRAGVTSFDGNDKNINDEETNGGRILLRWEPSDEMTLDFTYLKQNMKVGGTSRYTKKGSPAWTDVTAEVQALIDADPGIDGFTPLPGLPSLTPSKDFINTDITVNTRDDDVELFGATGTFDLGSGNLTVSASHYEHDVDAVFDSTPILLFFGVDTPGVTSQPQGVEIDMLEARFASTLDGKFNFLAGAYYQNEESEFQSLVTTTDGNGRAVPWNELNSNDFFGGGTAFFGRFRKDQIEQMAVFGEIYYDFTEQWELQFGMRYFDSQIESVQATTHNFGGAVGAPAGKVIGTTINGNGIGLIELDDDKVTSKVTLSYDYSDEIMMFATYSEGFRVGGVNNANQPFAPGIPSTYDSDELSNLEFGLKSRFMNGRVQLNGALFLIDWENIQVEPRDPAGNIPFTTNGGEAEVNGMEWSIKALLTDNLEFDFTGTYLFSHELTEDQPVLPGASSFVITGKDGDDIPNVPDLQLYSSLKYDLDVAGRNLSLIGDITYRDSTNTEFREDHPFNISLDSYTIANLYANYELTDKITLGVYAKNVTDEVAVYDGIGTFQDPSAIVSNRPRTIGVSLGWKL